jgi:hypothetical protein
MPADNNLFSNRPFTRMRVPLQVSNVSAPNGRWERFIPGMAGWRISAPYTCHFACAGVRSNHSEGIATVCRTVIAAGPKALADSLEGAAPGNLVSPLTSGFGFPSKFGSRFSAYTPKPPFFDKLALISADERSKTIFGKEKVKKRQSVMTAFLSNILPVHHPARTI